MEPLSEIEAIRRASRQMVRELGFLEDGRAALGVTHSECHALIELHRAGTLLAKDLSDRLALDKASLSRALSRLLKRGDVVIGNDRRDRRRKPLRLSPKGVRRVRAIDQLANTKVQKTLDFLSSSDRDIVKRGLSIYASALQRQRLASQLSLRPIRRADDPAVARLIRTVMPEFGATGPGFAINDREVDAMFNAYRPPLAAYWVVELEGQVVGGGGFAALAGGPRDTCELKKMYFLSSIRGLGIGRQLLEHAMASAAKAGYRRCYLETLESMGRARGLYERAGFERLAGPLGSTGHFSCNRWYLRPLHPPPGGDQLLAEAAAGAATSEAGRSHADARG